MIADRLWKDRNIAGTDLKVWCALEFIARGRGYLVATDEAIAEECGISPRTVRDSLQRLERAGFLRRDRDESGGRRITLRPDGPDGMPAAPEFRVIG